jgi:prevent-host-death family protein
MASQIEVRDLEARASAILREVHEQEAEFIVTLRGEPVAMLLPLQERDDRDLTRMCWRWPLGA